MEGDISKIDSLLTMSLPLPFINILQYSVGVSFAMGLHKPLLNPVNNMIFKHLFNNLVEKIGQQHFVDVSSGEMCGKRL